MGRFRRRFEDYQGNNPDMRYAMAFKRVKRVKGFYTHLAIYLIINTAMILANSDRKIGTAEFWSFETFSLAFCWGFGLALHGFSVFGRDFFFSKDWEDRKIREFIEKEKDNKRE
ncbi:MAG TPA: 2TM domain-containing protein [Flavobacterium sp.]|nr:2TM domain-containing protein [Flavobacterium sp.]